MRNGTARPACTAAVSRWNFPMRRPLPPSSLSAAASDGRLKRMAGSRPKITLAMKQTARHCTAVHQSGRSGSKFGVHSSSHQTTAAGTPNSSVEARSPPSSESTTASESRYCINRARLAPIARRIASSRSRIAESDQHHAGHVQADDEDRKSTRLNSSHSQISYAVFCLKKKKKKKKKMSRTRI